MITVKKSIFILLSLFWMIVIYNFSSKTSSVSSNESMFITDFIAKLLFENPSEKTLYIIEVIIRKVAHITEFAILSILYCFVFNSFGYNIRTTIWTVMFVFIYALSDEIHQYFVPGRACRLYDIVIDTVGGFLGYCFYCICYRIKQRLQM